MSIIGHIDSFLYQYPGDPTSVSTTIINPPKGAIVLDTTNGVLYRKTSALGSNSGYAEVADAATITAIVTAAPSGLGAAIATLITGSDLTVSGTLTTLATNIGAHDTQGVTLMSALIATTGALTSRTLVSPVISTGLTASGSAANTFAGSTGTFTTSTGLNTLGGKVAQKVVATPVAAAGSSTSDAAALGSANIVTISSDSAAKGVKLVAGVAGDIVHVLNTSSTAAILYPATGGTINGLAANAGVLVPASKGTKAVCTAADTWTSYDFAAKSTAA